MGHRTSVVGLTIAALSVTVLAACGGESAGNGPVEAAADGSIGAPASSADGDAALDEPAVPYGLVAPTVAADLAVDPGITVIDVRTPDEYAEGHLEGAALIDFYTDTFADEIGALDRDATYLIYCRSGNRSGQTHGFMRELGFENVYDLDGGVNAWSADGFALVAP